MATLQIEIHTHDRKIVSDFLEKSSVSTGDEAIISDQARIKYEGSYIRKAIGFPEIVYFILTFSLGVSASVIANWIYDKIKGKEIEKIIIEKTEVDLNREEITRIIKEKIEIKL